MKFRLACTTLAVAIVVVVVVPTTLFVAPPRAHAVAGIADTTTIIGDISATNIGDWIENTISAVANPTTAASTYWTALKGSVLDPLARMLAQAVLRSVTASIVDAINGRNGSPKFVTNLGLNLQMIGDRVGLSFIAQFGSSIHSPFSNAISSALRTNYLQGSSLAGFFAANQCTLTSASPNINKFLAGDWSQGGAGAWLALTTQNQNNPYTLYQMGLSKLNTNVASAQTSQRQTIAQNGGFLSWCSSGSSDKSNIGTTCSDFANGSDCNGTAVCVQTPGKTTGTCQAPTAATSDDTPSTCYNKDGTPGTIETPGSLIHEAGSKAFGSSIDDLISVHDFDQMVDTILATLVTKVVTTGLHALSDSSGSSSSSYTSQLANSTDANVTSVGTSIAALAQTTLTQVQQYTTSWQTIQSAAQGAQTSLQALSTCASQVNAAQTVLQNSVTPVLTQAQAALDSAAKTKALALKVQAESTATSAGSAGGLTADAQALAAAPPSAGDVANAQTSARTMNAATSTSSTSLTVTGGTTVDQMQLISKNAQNLQQACVLNPAP